MPSGAWRVLGCGPFLGTETVVHQRDPRFRNLCRRFDGAYNLVYLDAMGNMVVARDPLAEPS